MKFLQNTLWIATALVWLAALSSVQTTEAFMAPTPSTSSLRSSTSLDAASRRGVLSRIKGAVVGVATFGAFRQRPSVALAEEVPETTSGRIVELQIANLNGEEGKTGTVKIQLRPEWAPRGVKRFEVSRTNYAPTFVFRSIPQGLTFFFSCFMI